ncbi:hypothetical protein [Candidatus Cyanaurora vandensis]|uniref:hypothetical protein n=1 Tax=Candidatus Cyanaurora vandensis TaxID=2714958 RepID=UPI00257AFD3D|nr:hypothetical protein [Candidatus Cyanaurora vandensis]
MTHNAPSLAPCIIDAGIVVNKRDMLRLLEDLGRVSYEEIRQGQVYRRGEGYVMEVYCDPSCATVVVNRTLYLNVNSFDYLELDAPENERPRFNLVLDGRILSLRPLSDPISEREEERQSEVHTPTRDVLSDVVLTDWDEDDEVDL